MNVAAGSSGRIVGWIARLPLRGSCFGQSRLWVPGFTSTFGGCMAKITGIGGVFFKSTGDHKKLSEWYASNLGLPLEDWGGAILKWSGDTANDEGLTVWSVAAPDTRWFQPSSASFMINYRVDSLDGMLAQLKANGIEPVKGPESAENGKFAWILDPDGNKVELWEPMLWDDKNKQ